MEQVGCSEKESSGSSGQQRESFVNVEWLTQGTSGSQRPGPRWGHSVLALPGSGDLLLLGGACEFMSAFTESWIFSVSARCWRTLDTSNCPALSAHSASLVRDVGNPKSDCVVCFGGDGGHPADNAPYLLDTSSWSWRTVQASATSDGRRPAWRRTHTSVAIGQAVLIIAGDTSSGFLDDIWSLDLTQPGNEKWICTDDYCSRFSRRGSHSATLVDESRVILFGGFNGQQLGDLWLIDVSLGSVSCKPALATGKPPSPRSGHAAVHVPAPSPCIIFVGGEFQIMNEFSHGLELLDTERLVWATVNVGGTSWKARGWGTATWSPASPTEVFIFGGGLYDKFLDDLTVLQLDTMEAPPLCVSEVGNDLGALLDGTLGDILLEAVHDGGSVSAHRAILFARSPVFAAMLGPGTLWAESGEGAVKMPCGETALRTFLRFVYTGYVEETDLRSPPVALEVLELAGLYMLPTLVRSCSSSLARQLRWRRTVSFDGSNPEVMAELEQLAGSCVRVAECHAAAIGSSVLAQEAALAMATVSAAQKEHGSV
ncbi:unnamed protein product [Polarella glacialis]|uniref:BTB domain-containing protein n=1 Tax=Polarella glacialis TaxID=89957 RepID=A0A813KNI0_POLGL|nr:unnamed protein product [Polarella glacialis]